MKKIDLTKLWGVTFLIICVCTLYASPSNAGTISDNFNGASINTRLWQPFHADQHQRVAQQGGELRIQIDGASVGDDFGAGLNSKFLVKGNFEMTVDYRLITWPEANGVRMGFEGPGFSPDSYAGFMIKRKSYGADEPPTPKEQYNADFDEGGGWYGFQVPTTDMSGKLKLTRVGSLLTGSFWQNNAWQLIGSHDYSTSPGLPEWVAISLWANSKTTGQYPNGTVNVFAGKDVEIAYDNFQVNYDQIRYTSDPSPIILLLLD